MSRSPASPASTLSCRVAAVARSLGEPLAPPRRAAHGRQFFVPDIAKLLTGRREAKSVGGKRVLQSQLRCGFGAASSYMTQDAFLIVVGFAERALDPRAANLATMVARYIRAGTYRMVDAGRWFS